MTFLHRHFWYCVHKGEESSCYWEHTDLIAALDPSQLPPKSPVPSPSSRGLRSSVIIKCPTIPGTGKGRSWHEPAQFPTTTCGWSAAATHPGLQHLPALTAKCDGSFLSRGEGWGLSWSSWPWKGGQGAAAMGKWLVAAAVNVRNGWLAEMMCFTVRDGRGPAGVKEARQESLCHSSRNRSGLCNPLQAC